MNMPVGNEHGADPVRAADGFYPPDVSIACFGFQRQETIHTSRHAIAILHRNQRCIPLIGVENSSQMTHEVQHVG